MPAWDDVEAVLDAVLDAPPEERARLLAAHCKGDEALRREVEGFLSDLDAAQGFMNAPALEFLDPETAGGLIDELFGVSLVGQHIGRYEVVEEIGRGGMGSVYEAVRADGAYEMRVALKLIKRGMDTDEIVRRFRYERQILAGLQHPNVARLLDGGVVESGPAVGVPYFVLELVEGRPITEHAAREALDVQGRLQLFEIVCEAVQYAHRSLVVHRDLKPSNVLVDAAGQPKLLDFGIAKVLQPEDHPTDIPITQADERRLTPEYAAPEQVTGAPTTTATDVYALGVILYELLAEQRPYTFKSRRLQDIEAAICDEVPARPSSTAPPERQADLAGDLDAIVLKALKKEPHLRYASAGDLLNDLRRYRHGQPVEAQDDTVRYRAGKFVQRNRLAVGLGSLAVLALVLGLMGSLWQAREARLQAERAEAQAERSERTLQFLVDTFSNLTPEATQSGGVVQIEDLVDVGRQRLDALDAVPLDRARLLDVLGEVATNLGLFGVSDSLYAQAAALKAGELGAAHPDVAASRGGQALAMLNGQGPSEDVEAMMAEAVAVLDANGPAYLEAAAQARAYLGFLYLLQGRMPEAGTEFKTVIAQVGARQGETFVALRLLALRLLGIVQSRTGETENAEASLREALALSNRLNGPGHSETANVMFSLAEVVTEQGNLDEAERLMQDVLESYRRTYGPEHPTAGNVFHQLAGLRRERGDAASAEAYYQQALEVYEATGHSYLPRTLEDLGVLYEEQGRLAEAVATLERALRLHQEAGLPAESPRLMRLEERLSRLSG